MIENSVKGDTDGAETGRFKIKAVFCDCVAKIGSAEINLLGKLFGFIVDVAEESAEC